MCKLLATRCAAGYIGNSNAGIEIQVSIPCHFSAVSPMATRLRYCIRTWCASVH